MVSACTAPATGPSATTPTPVSPTPTPSAAASPIPKIPDPVAVEVPVKGAALLVLDITSVICPPRPTCVASVPKIAALVKKARDADPLAAPERAGIRKCEQHPARQGARHAQHDGQDHVQVGRGAEDKASLLIAKP